MKTSREVHDQIRWDPALDERRFSVGYQERFSGTSEISFLEFRGGPIPWSRVLYYKLDQQIVWHRTNGIDCFGNGTIHELMSSSEEPQEKAKPAPALSLPVYRFDPSAQRWKEAPPGAPIEGSEWLSSLTVATYNILFDLYEKELLDLAPRMPLLLEEIEGVRADLVALQEVTPPFFAELLNQQWLQDHYFISDAPGGISVRPSGVVLLSRYPLSSVSLLSLAREKKAIVADVVVGCQLLRACVVHLSSQRAPNAVAVRAEQLSQIQSELSSRDLQADATILLGDFNYRAEEDQYLRAMEYKDVWPIVRPDDPGLTYNPSRNSLAELVSESGAMARYDRIFFQSGAMALTPQRAWLFGTVPDKEGKFPSDHFGLSCTFRAHPQSLQPVRRSAVVLIPPEDLWGPIQAIRQQNDKNIHRWMPHITLVYGFLPEDHFEQAAQLLIHALSNFESFSVKLSTFCSFQHRQSSTVWLQPVDDPPWMLQELQATIENLFPQCNQQSTLSDQGFTPHLSVGQGPKDAAQLAALVDPWQSQWSALSFEVTEVQLISRREDEPFEVRHRIPLQKIVGSSEPSIQAKKTDQRQLLAALGDAHRQVLSDCGTSLPYDAIYQIGSTALGAEMEDQDIDILCLCPTDLERMAFFTSFLESLNAPPDLEWHRIAQEAKVPTLKMNFNGTRVDVQYARFPEEAPLSHPRFLSPHQIQLFDEADRRALLGYLDLQALLRELGDRKAIFREVLPVVKQWAKAKGLTSASFGYLNGFSWSLLTAWVCKQMECATPLDQILRHFFASLAGWEWHRPIAIAPEGQAYAPSRTDRMQIITPTPPCQNSARNITPATLQIIQQELKCAHELFQQTADPMAQLLTPVPWSFEWYLAIGIEGDSEDALRVARGVIESQFLTLLLALEGIPGLFPRPIPQWHQPALDKPSSLLLCGLNGTVEPLSLKELGNGVLLRLHGRMSNVSLDIHICTAEEAQAQWPHLPLDGNGSHDFH